ncbi:MAG: DUF1552 domain-containing protein, partial [Deltaproteobacteria bacterium]|nr:DUF1552 domain-containing protein [Deltaproteobacteria bacterium]
GGLASLLGSSSRTSRAAETAPPTRVVFFVTAHGHTPNSWVMPVPGGSTTDVAERALTPLAVDEFSTLLQPLHPFRDRLLVVEGLANTINLVNLAEATASGNDNNNHSLAVAGLLTGDRVKQTPGAPCTGGARSIDQELAQRLIAPGRFGSRVYGYDYTPNLTVAPFSFLGSAQSSPIVASPQVAYDDLLGIYVPPPSTEPQTRAQLINSLRPSVLDSVAREYEFLAPRLDTAGRQRLDAHRQLVRELETSLGAGPSAVCDTSFDNTGHETSQFMRLIKMRSRAISRASSPSSRPCRRPPRSAIPPRTPCIATSTNRSPVAARVARSTTRPPSKRSSISACSTRTTSPICSSSSIP